MTIYELFSNVKKAEIDSVLKQYGITIPPNFSFSKFNIAIGINGSGKTRFLNAIKDLSKKNRDKVIYGYFPKLSHEKVNIDLTGENLPEATLKEALNLDCDFDDFLEEIQKQNVSFLPDLLHFRSKLQKEQNDKALSCILDTFNKLTGLKIVVNNESVLIEQNGSKTDLEAKLDEFSPGQLMLFYLSIFIAFQNKNEKKIIILDEPECHLHPNALMEFVSLLTQSECFSNLFIATHSLFLVPEFEFESIVYLDNSTVVPRNSSLYNDLFSNMVGKDYDNKMAFFSYINQWQYSEYLEECFKEPDIIERINPEDEQVLLFVEFLKRKKSVKVLDFGAGQARLGRSFMKTDYKDKDKVKYEFYDIKKPTDNYGFGFYSKFNDIPKKHFDCVVMMNVLHEIEPSEWTKIFNNIYKVMADDSYLLFIETSILSKGEMPNKTGYLVLDNHELQTLFDSDTAFPTISISEKQKTSCIIIRKKHLLSVTDLTVHMAIKELEKNTYNKILEERKTKNSPRKYAFLTQLYLNAKIFNDNYLLNGKKSMNFGRKNINYADFSQYDKEILVKEIEDYSNNIDPKNTQEIIVNDYLKTIIKFLKHSHSNNIIIGDNIYYEIIGFENDNLTRKQLIAVCFLALLLTDNKVVEMRFNTNNYARNLPLKIRRVLDKTTTKVV